MSLAFIRFHIFPYGGEKLKKGQDDLVFTVNVLDVFYFIEKAVHGAVCDLPVDGQQDGLEPFERVFYQRHGSFCRFRRILLEQMIQPIFHLRSKIVLVSLLCQASTS